VNNRLFKNNQNDAFGKVSPDDSDYVLVNSINNAIASAILTNIVEYVLYDSNGDPKIAQVKEVEEFNDRLMSLFNKHKYGLSDLRKIFDEIKPTGSPEELKKFEKLEKFKDFVNSLSMILLAREIVGNFASKHFNDFLKIMTMIKPHPKDSEFQINPDDIIPVKMFKIE